VNLGAVPTMLSVSLQRRLLLCLISLLALPAALTAQVNLLSTPFAPVGNAPRNVAVADLDGDGKADLVAVNSIDNTISVLLSNGDGTFRPAVTYAVGAQPNDVAIADFNGDGKPDLAVTSLNAKQVSVLLGNGDGTFQAAVNYPTSDMTLDLVVADFNGDGKLDIAATDFSGGVSILLGNGDGTFQGDRPFSIGNYAAALAVGDFNRDGKADLAVANSLSNLTIFLGNGDGTFTQGATYTLGEIQGVAVGDLNLDGKPDLVITTGNGSSPPALQVAANVLLGNGDGTFAAPVNYGTAAWPTGVVVADFNGDGNPDLAISDQLTNTVVLLTGQGDGTFQASFLYAVGGGPEGIAVGDFNGDGKIDLATANYMSNDASTLLGNGDGTFRGARSYDGIRSSTLLVADLNHDGKLDAVWGLGLMLGNGDGTLQQPPLDTGLSGGTNGAPVTADFNHDGNLDLAATTDVNLGSDDQAVGVVLGNGDGTFQPEKLFGVNFLGPQYLITADFNGDGNPDLIVTGAGSNSLAIALGDGTGNFQFQFIPSGISGQIATADFNRDGKPDFIVIGYDGGLYLFLGTGDGTFQSSIAINNAPGGTSLTGLIAADVNGDGIPDVVVVNNTVGGRLSVMLGNGDGTFANPVNYAVGDYPESVALGDLNQDGYTDLVVALNTGRVVVLLGNGDGTFQPAINFGSMGSGGNVAVAVADLNGSGYPDVLVANSSGLGTLTILSNQTNSSPPAASTVGLSSSLNPAASGEAVTLTVVVAPANGGSAVPTGSVTFRDGLIALGSATLSAGTGTLTLSTLSVGTHNLTAVYSGDAHFYGNTSAGLVQVVNANPFTVTASGTGSASITPGQKAQYQLMLVSGTAQSQTVSLSCSGAPPSSTCTVSPNPATLSGTSTTNVTVTVQTAGPNSSLTLPLLPNRSKPIFPAARWQSVALAIFFCGVLTGATRKPGRTTLGLPLLLLIGLAACSSGNSGSSTQGTPPASYTIVVTAQSSAGTQQIKLALTVNP
jgi:hypothetical protein